jgi:DNA modification methylase
MLNKCHIGDCRTLLRDFVTAGVRAQMCVTSPPYFGLRDYGHPGQLGLEPTPTAFVEQLVAVFAAVRDVLADDGTVWLNLGDSYAGSWGAQGRQGATGQMANRSVISARQIAAHPKKQKNTGSVAHLEGLKAKDLIGIPWRVAFALQADGWYLRSDIIWNKPNPMPESIEDRPTKCHEYLFLLSKSERYFYDYEASKELADPQYAGRYNYAFGGNKSEKMTAEEAQGAGSRTHPIGEREYDGKRNRRTVWTIPTASFDGAHFATFPPALVEPCILAGSRTGDVVLDPFMGSGTTAQVAEHLGRQWIGCELNADYVPLQQRRIAQRAMAL